MKIIAEVPGSCGELLQGTVAGQPLLVTCPIDQYSRAVLEEGAPLELPPKAEKMARLASAFYGVALDSVRITLQSELPRSKGMSSSSADMAAVASVIAHYGKKEIDPWDILNLCLQVEPTDGTFFPGIVGMDHLAGTFVESLGISPQIEIQIFDLGGEVDTGWFNQRKELALLNRQKEPAVLAAWEELKIGFSLGDVSKIAEGATQSARAHQSILFKSGLDELIDRLPFYGALGIVVAHSGTVIGVLWDEYDEALWQSLQAFVAELIPDLTFLTGAKLIQGGIRVWEET